MVLSVAHVRTGFFRTYCKLFELSELEAVAYPCNLKEYKINHICNGLYLVVLEQGVGVVEAAGLGAGQGGALAGVLAEAPGAGIPATKGPWTLGLKGNKQTKGTSLPVGEQLPMGRLEGLPV